MTNQYKVQIKGKALVSGQVEGSVIATDTPLSFWGGFDPQSGCIIDQHHPLSGELLANKIVALPSGRGSCTGSGILLEAIFARTAPAAILLKKLDEIIVLGSIVGDEFLHKTIPIIVLQDQDFETVMKAEHAWINKDEVTLLMKESVQDSL